MPLPLFVFLASLTPDELVLLSVTSMFVSAGLALIAFIFYSRIRKAFLIKQREGIVSAMAPLLNELIVNDADGGNGKEFNHILTALEKVAGSSPFRRRVCIEHLLTLKKSLSGKAADVLEDAYNGLHLEKDSLSKLQAAAWHEKARGVRELAEMHQRESIDRIRPYLNNPNRTLAEECMIGMARLDPHDSFSFLDQYGSEISPWVTINIFQHLQGCDERALPLFSKWFQSKNPSVVLFSVAMVCKFRQLQAIPALVQLLKSANTDIVVCAVRALGELEAFEHAGALKELATTSADNELVIAAILQSLGKTGSPVNDLPFIMQYTGHPKYRVRFEAVRALKTMGVLGKASERVEGQEEVDKIIAHHADALL